MKNHLDGILSANIGLKIFASKYSLKENEQRCLLSVDVP